MRWDADVDTMPSPSSSEASLDDDDVNCRLNPYWPKYRGLFKARGLHLETVRDVRPYYRRLQTSQNYCIHNSVLSVLSSQEGSQHDHDLFHDPSVPDNLFRGQRICDGRRFVVKAVHSHSREYSTIRFLSCSPIREDRSNHTIPLLDLFECHEDHIAFIVMEQWSPELFTESSPCCPEGFLLAVRQLLEHVDFMHRHRLAHLDISIRNLVTDHQGRYAFIDFELSRVLSEHGPYLYAPGHQATEIPPECEKSDYFDPFKVDIWALGVLILRACKTSGLHIPELLLLTRPMLHDKPEQRPPASAVLETYDKMLIHMRPKSRVECSNRH
ncbi:other/AgaK1 protein kinase [Coprinopsis cinerea AmutBmut pab1-1]|nr:other/AgaK1 protein kinase [Coprinopsis cinerea AmutBmut pab1-1]